MVAVPATLQAQVRDTIPRDTAVIPIPPEVMEDDTVPDTALASEDSIFPAPTIPEYPHPAPTGWAWANWEWGRDELAGYHGLSLVELIERIPGIVVTRAGGFGRPTGVSALGMGGGRVRLFIDGYELDPLASATPDLQHYGIADIGSLRVSRSLNEVRIEISTYRLQDSRPYSRIEIGAGNYETKLLRALFSRTIGSRNIVTAAFGLASTRGIGIAEPFTRNLGALGWSYSLSPEIGFEAQYRFTGVERRSNAEGVPQIFDENVTRQDLLLRARARPFQALTLEGIVGRSWRTPADSTSFVDDELASTQAVLRAVYQTGPAWLNGSARVRTGSDRGVSTPGLDLALRGGLRPLPWLQANGEVRHGNAGDIAGVDLSATVRAGAWWGISLFGTVASGERGLGLVRDSTFMVPREVETEVDGVVRVDTVQVDTTVYSYPAVASGSGGFRLGAEWSASGIVAGVAFIHLGDGTAVPFGTSFDSALEPLAVDNASGLETYFSIPVLLEGLRLEGTYSRWSEVGDRPYLPVEAGRVALVLHDVYYDGQFEPTLRVEGVRRGSALVPDVDGNTFTASSPAYNVLNVLVQIRIQDVQAYIGWRNVLNNVQAVDLPGLHPRFPRMMYGVSWDFHN